MSLLNFNRILNLTPRGPVNLSNINSLNNRYQLRERSASYLALQFTEKLRRAITTRDYDLFALSCKEEIESYFVLFISLFSERRERREAGPRLGLHEICWTL